jgi:hypothetical protein
MLDNHIRYRIDIFDRTWWRPTQEWDDPVVAKAKMEEIASSNPQLSFRLVKLEITVLAEINNDQPTA